MSGSAVIVVGATTLDGYVIISMARVPADVAPRVRQALERVCSGIGYAHVSILDLVVVSTHGTAETLRQIARDLADHGIRVNGAAS